MSNQHYDVVIVGGGVTGGSTACFLASQNGFDGSILVVERDPTYENAPSAKATGGFRQQFSAPENIQIGLFGVHFIKHIGDYLSVDGDVPDVGFRENGYLLLATERSLPVMRENNAVQREQGADVVFQSPGDLEARFPWLSTEGLAGGFLGLRNEGWVDPYSLVQAYKRKARSLGVTYLPDEVVDITRYGNRVSGVTLRDGGEMSAGIVVNAGGARDAVKLSMMVNVPLPIEPRKRTTFVINCRTPIGPTPLTITPEGIGFRPEGKNFLWNRAPPPELDPVTDDLEMDHYLFDEHIWPALATRVPAFQAVKVVGGWTCHYDFNTLDENVIIGRPPDVENFYMAAGFSGHGLQQSPAIGRALSELIGYGEFRSIDLTRFGYERVLTGEKVLETNCY